MVHPPAPARQPWQMFALSFTALFLEMMVIRWVPSVVHFVAYYANLMLLSSFLGLGVGAIAADRKWRLFDWFPLLLAVELATLWFCRSGTVGGAGGEIRFFASSWHWFSVLLLIWIFAVNAAVFVPLGQQMGTLFNTMPRLTAYAWDLAGSLGGTLCFAVFSLRLFSPVLGMAIVMVAFLVMSQRRWRAAALFAALLALLFFTRVPGARWSPYYYITVHPLEAPEQVATEAPPDLRTMRDPPIYGVFVNQFGYHYDGTFVPGRYTPGTQKAALVATMIAQYGLPYAVTPRRDRVLIVGAGGGSDVEAALQAGVRHVDAVEIDPVVVQVSQQFNAGAPYADPRVTVHVDDARAYLQRSPADYDLVVFGFLDSQALFSSMSNVRLDGYVYTVESLRTAYGLLNEQGVLSLSFALSQDWLGPKLFQMVATATGRQPAMYISNQQMTLIVPKDPALKLPAGVGRFVRTLFVEPPKVDSATDDWPFLYLRGKTIPGDYLIAIGSLVLFSVGALIFLRRGAFGREDLHFGFLGAAFLLLETKSITDCTLLFGATWLVTLVVVAGVLGMVLASNLVAARLRSFSFGWFAPLLGALVLLYFVPREQILGLGFGLRLLWVILVVPLPIFFAGIIFSTTFRDAKNPAAAFGANLIGAMLGGFCEYLGMATGSHRLSLLVFALYLGSWLTLRVARRVGIVTA